MMELLCTLGPATFHEKEIKRLTQLGVNLFRINLSHTKAHEIKDIVNLIRQYSDVPICLDSEGAQVRTGDFKEISFTIKENEEVFIPAEKVIGLPHEFNLYPLDIVRQLRCGDLISIDFNAVLVRVIECTSSGVKAKVINGGQIGKNKAVTVDRLIKMPPLTPKDIEALAIGKELGIQHVALSFANRASDVEEIRKHVLPGTFIISKIECLNALSHLDSIIKASDAVLIDRGDLSREVPIESVPLWQKKIIAAANIEKKKVYVATNLLETMVTAPYPTRAEINDVFNTLSDGADGLVLAAETAIGKYPIECATMVQKVIKIYKNKDLSDLSEISSMLIEPHGGKLIQQFVSEDYNLAANLPKIRLDFESLLDCEQIAHGTYSPLKGFMTEKEILSVLSANQLPSGVVWTLPITLQLSPEQKKNIGNASEVLVLDLSGKPHSLIKIKNIFEFNIKNQLKLWFGTEDQNHPGLKKLLEKGNTFLAGDVFLLESSTFQNAQYSMAPKKIRTLFNKKGWTQVVGFHTRNVPHRAHEYIQRTALELTNADGLLISPVMGAKKSGDFIEDIIFRSYELAISSDAFPKNKTVLSGFNTFSRYSGPREAVFTALCRKNMGCSHFIVGRDHTGVGNYYGPRASQEIFEKVGDIGLKTIFYPEIAYNSATKIYENVREGENYIRISGTEVRQKLKEKNHLPSWFIQDEIQSYIQNVLAKGEKVFVE